MFESRSAEAAFAYEAVREAAKLCRLVEQERVLPALSKEDRSPVTVADFASQALVAWMLGRRDPGRVLVAEEDSTALRSPAQARRLQAVTEVLGRWIPEATPERVCGWIDRGAAEPGDEFWTLDPIDGTKGFLRGDQYVVALALIVDGQPKVGALGCPNLHPEVRADSAGPGSVAIAVAGEGAWIGSLEGGPRRPLRVSTCEQPACGRMLRSFESAHTNPAQIKALGESMGLRAEPVLMDSQAKYVMLAGGEGEVIFRILSPKRPDYVEKIWDHAAGSLIVEEAGGRMTDLRGERLDFGRGRLLRENLGVLATNGALHEPALRALEGVGANRRPEGV